MCGYHYPIVVQREIGLKVYLKPQVLLRSGLSRPEKLLDPRHNLKPIVSPVNLWFDPGKIAIVIQGFMWFLGKIQTLYCWPIAVLVIQGKFRGQNL